MVAALEAVHPVLMAQDIAVSVRFYHLLGFEVQVQDDAGNPRYAVIRRDSTEVHLQWQDARLWAYPIDRPSYRFKTRDVDTLYAEFLQRGAITESVTVASPWTRPADTPWGTREFHLYDPARNSLQFYRALK